MFISGHFYLMGNQCVQLVWQIIRYGIVGLSINGNNFLILINNIPTLCKWDWVEYICVRNLSKLFFEQKPQSGEKVKLTRKLFSFFFFWEFNEVYVMLCLKCIDLYWTLLVVLFSTSVNFLTGTSKIRKPRCKRFCIFWYKLKEYTNMTSEKDNSSFSSEI